MRSFKLMFLFWCFGMLIFMPSVYADIPNKTVVLGDKAYNFKYANSKEHYPEIIEQLMLIDDYQIYLKGSDGNWYQNSSGNIVDNTNIPFVTYKNGEGKITEYYHYDGEEFKLEVISASFLSDSQVKIIFNKEVDQASALDKSMYVVDSKILGDNDRIELLDDKKTVVIVLESPLELDKKHNIYVSEKISDSYHNSIGSAYKKNTLLLNDFSKLQESTLNNVDIIATEKIFSSKVVNGDIYLSGSNLKIKNCTIKGKIFVDPGDEGNVEIANVKADEIVVLSGGENSIHLIDSEIKKLNIMSKNKSKLVRVVLESNTKILKTFISSNVILDVINGEFGTVDIENFYIDEKIVELRGSFRGSIVLRGNINLKAAHNAKIKKVKIEPVNFNPRINLEGNFESVEVNRQSNMRITSGKVKKLIANSKVILIILEDAVIELLEDIRDNAEFEGKSKGRVTKIKGKDDKSSRDKPHDSHEYENERNNGSDFEHNKPTVRLSNINDVSINVDQEKAIDLSVDSNVRIEVSSSNNDIVETVIDGHTIHLIGKNQGQALITVTGRRNGYKSKSTTFNVTVNPKEIINHVPTVAQTITDQIAREGEDEITIDVSKTFIDADGDTLTISAVSDNEEVATVVVNGTELVVTPVSEGTAVIKVTADDKKGGTVSTNFNMTVFENKTSVSIDQFLGYTTVKVKNATAEGNDVTIKIIDKSNNSIKYNEQLKIENGECKFRVRLEAGRYDVYINVVNSGEIIQSTFTVIGEYGNIEIYKDQDDTVIRMIYPYAVMNPAVEGTTVTIKIIDESNNSIEYNEQGKFQNGVCEFRIRLEPGVYKAYINIVYLNKIQAKGFTIDN
ncbi:Ig-like domain-containing protein [Oceanirhabdus seepicola]|uniref:BIG2 domain-containing protein n=1 Tax=Oceanirhabdus seepicola TaxID=2828781 RepID=A0A9J6NZF5_9CLOT|nr:hypothetical protein [Oceanirhabdus seepicola]MCM1989818.1 hypothetical protein [Oceanirhabdus seepicola]